MPGLRVLHTYGLIHDRRHTLQLTLRGERCKAKQASQTGCGHRSQFSHRSTSPCGRLFQVTPGQGTSAAIGVTRRWVTHATNPSCSVTLQSQPCLQPVCAPVNTFSTGLGCVPGVPERGRQEATGPKLAEGGSSRGGTVCPVWTKQDNFALYKR